MKRKSNWRRDQASIRDRAAPRQACADHDLPEAQRLYRRLLTGNGQFITVWLAHTTMGVEQEVLATLNAMDRAGELDQLSFLLTYPQFDARRLPPAVVSDERQ